MPGLPALGLSAPGFLTMAATAVLLTSCSLFGGDEAVSEDVSAAPPNSARAATEQLISGPLAEEIGLGDLTATCPDMSEAIVGLVFQCTALTEQQITVNVAAEVLPTGQIDLSTTNVIAADAIESFERAAVDALNTTLTEPLAYGNMDCGSTAIILTVDQTVLCGLFDPQTEAIFDVTLSITNLENREFSLVVADVPRR